jgi:hypothetical protein
MESDFMDVPYSSSVPDRLSVPPLQGSDCKVRRLIAQRDLPWAHLHPLSCSLYANDMGDTSRKAANVMQGHGHRIQFMLVDVVLASPAFRAAQYRTEEEGDGAQLLAV